MSRLESLIKKVFRNQYLKYSFLASTLFFGCGDDENPVKPPVKEPEKISSIDNTNKDGYVKLEVGSSSFDVYTKNLNNQPLSNIKVSGVKYGSIYGFLAEDFNLGYLSEIYYTGGFSKSSNFQNLEVKMFMRAKENNERRRRKFPDLRNNTNLEFLGTTSLSDLKSFYREYDAIFNNMSLLEFTVKATGENAFDYVLRAAKFREDIINNAESYSKIINEITSLVGQEYDADAFYFDVYRHKSLNVINHYYDEDKLCTLKGKVTNSNNNPINSAYVNVNGAPLFTNTDSNGNYTIKSYINFYKNITKMLTPNTYNVVVSKSGYQTKTTSTTISAPTPPYYTSTKMNFQLYLINEPQTITIQPGPSDGKDSRVENVKNSEGTCLFYCDDNFGSGDQLNVVSRVQSNGIEHKYRSYLQFDLSQIPSGATISSAALYLYGDPAADHNSTSNLNVECREVTSSWLENSITWNSQPSLGDIQDTKTINYDGKPLSASDAYWESWNVTNLVKQWKNNQKPNYGLSITTSDSPELKYCEFQMISSDYSYNSSLRPKLVVTYTK